MTLMQMFAPGEMVRALWWNTVADKQGDTPVWKKATVTRVRMEKQEVFFAGRTHGESGITLLLPLYDIKWEDESSSQTQGHRPDNVKPLLPDSQPGSAGAVPGSEPGSEKGWGAAKRAKKRHKSGSASVAPAGSASGSAGPNKSDGASRPSRSCTLRAASVPPQEEDYASMSPSEDEDAVGVESDESSEWQPSDASGSEGETDEEDAEESSEYDSTTQSSEDEEDDDEILD